LLLLKVTEIAVVFFSFFLSELHGFFFCYVIARAASKTAVISSDKQTTRHEMQPK
jgi:hypothetical protein